MPDFRLFTTPESPTSRRSSGTVDIGADFGASEADGAGVEDWLGFRSAEVRRKFPGRQVEACGGWLLVLLVDVTPDALSSPLPLERRLHQDPEVRIQPHVRRL